MQLKYPNKLTIHNINYFFTLRPVGRNQITPGNLIQFRYQSPDHELHDRNPLIYVLEVEGDRVWGLNLHYKFNLLGEVIEKKKTEVAKIKAPAPTPINNKGEDVTKPLPDQVSGKIPSLQKIKQDLNKKQIKQPDIKIPNNILEKYSLSQVPQDILRNYLFTRMSTTNKLFFKVL